MQNEDATPPQNIPPTNTPPPTAPTRPGPPPSSAATAPVAATSAPQVTDVVGNPLEVAADAPAPQAGRPFSPGDPQGASSVAGTAAAGAAVRLVERHMIQVSMRAQRVAGENEDVGAAIDQINDGLAKLKTALGTQ